ncbi:MAG: molecular chaperone HtpG [Oscillospiraceae bacterium]|jgi:molecular chaperone HtpG|nr:molecular chaperone HtpG [Oscillospiraceae bacterium]
MSTKGKISINAQNIMPIIKKWLYSDKDIFMRELVSNASDAITKHSRLVQFGTAKDAEAAYEILVKIDKEGKKLTFEDNGIGMTAEELERYINQVAFSGAEEFLKKYEGAGEGSQIIGHFGLGFYSAFMVAKRVTIDTLSWQEGAAPVKWVSKDGMEFEMSAGSRESRGTTITLDLAEDSEEFISSYTTEGILKKYCAFLSTPLKLISEGEEPKQINETAPLWLKRPQECTEEEYRAFYKSTFNDYNEPLFWVHLNADHPFNLKGILYFPHYHEGLGSMEGQVKMFCGQVFVADNVKEVIPEFLLLLRGVIDCPDLPLNVSRSFLQNDDYVRKLSAYITRKVADKLISIFENDREKYNGYWSDINPFVKYGCMKDAKFFEKVKKAILIQTAQGESLSLEELSAKAADEDKTIYYANDAKRQTAAIKLYTQKGYTVALFVNVIDLNFISFLEYSDTGLKFKRIDSDTAAIKSDEAVELDLERLTALFRKAEGNNDLKVSAESFEDKSVHAMMIYDEQMRRFKEMSRFYGESMQLPEEKSLLLNSNSPLIKWLDTCQDEAKTELICNQVVDLADLMIQPLSDERMAEFIERSSKILDILAE